MEKRAFKRIPASVNVRFNCCYTPYLGTVMNLSEKGMFISTKKICLPFDSQFEIIISMKEKVLHVPVNLSRIITSHDSSDGIGVELSNTPKEYLEFVDSLRPRSRHLLS